MAMADAGLTAGSRVEWAGSGGGAGADRQPTHFPGMSSPSRTLALEPKQEW